MSSNNNSNSTKERLNVISIVNANEFCDICGMNKQHSEIIRITAPFSKTDLCHDDCKDLVEKIETELIKVMKEGKQ